MKTPQNVFYAHGFGKAAPWVDLANSEEWDGFGKRTDHLSDPEWLAAFQKHWKLAPLSHGKSSRLRLLKLDRKSTRLNSSHSQISYAVFCLQKKNHETRPFLLTRALD